MKPTKEEIIEILTEFIADDLGMWEEFEIWLKQKGYTLKELELDK